MAIVKALSVRPYSEVGAGAVACGTGSWADVKAGTLTRDLGTNNYIRASSSLSGTGVRVGQGIFAFDLSSIPIDAKIASATLKLYGTDYNAGSSGQEFHVFLSDWDGKGAMATADYTVWTGLTASDEATDSSYDFAIYSAYSLVTHNLNALGVAGLQAALSTRAFSLFGLTSDALNEVGGGFDSEVIDVELTGTEPVLTITYAVGNGLQLGVNI